MPFACGCEENFVLKTAFVPFKAVCKMEAMTTMARVIGANRGGGALLAQSPLYLLWWHFWCFANNDSFRSFGSILGAVYNGTMKAFDSTASQWTPIDVQRKWQV